MAKRKLGLFSKIMVVLGAVVVLLVLRSAWYFWKRPLTVDAWRSRSALQKADLRVTRVPVPSGVMTVFSGGSGPHMVLLHGAGDQAGAWAGVVPYLVQSYQLFIPDLPGHWKSPPLDGPLGIDVVLQGLVEVMTNYSPKEPAVLVGNSMGAWIAMLYAHQHPDRVERVVAVNGGALRQDDLQVDLFPTNREEARRTMAGLMGPSAPELPGFVLEDVVRHARVGPAARLAETEAEMDEYLLDGRLHEVTVPVELVWGDADQLLPLDYAQRLLDGLPRARLHVLAGCGHLPHRECPQETAKAVKKALAEPYPEAPGTEAETADEGNPEADGATAAGEEPAA